MRHRSASLLTCLVSALGACSDSSVSDRLRATVLARSTRLGSVEVLGVAPGVRGSDGTWTRQCGVGQVDGLLTDFAVVMSTAATCGGGAGMVPVLQPSAMQGAPIVIWIDIVDPSCDESPSSFDGHLCDTEGSATIYCGPAKSFGARELTFDPANLLSEAEDLPPDLDVDSINDWLEANRDAINARIAALTADNVAPALDTTTVGLEVACVDPVGPVGPAGPTADGCQGTTSSASVERVDFVDATPVGRDVIVLIDQSGSISGLVDGSDHREGAGHLPPNFRDYASDRTGLRIVAAKHIAGKVPRGDRVRFFGFNETGVTEVDVNALNGLVDRAQGRSNLWKAVETAYDELANMTAPAAIIVLTDGFDTCAGEQRDACTSPCVTGDYPGLLARVAADRQAGHRVAIDVIQFEAIGYPTQDARLMEIACVSGGHYRFIDSADLRAGQTFADAMTDAASATVGALAGRWQIAAALPEWASVPAGAVYQLGGALTLMASSHLVAADTAVPLDVATSDWDGRPAVRKPCAGAADCGADTGPCAIGCSAETHTCAPSGALQPDLAACEADGTPGFCCAGFCSTAGTCAACTL